MTHEKTELEALLPDLMRLARLLTRNRDTAEDLAQEALLSVCSRLAKGEDIRALRPYLMTTLRNAYRRTRAHPNFADADEDAMPGHPPEAPQRMACREVLKAIATLPPHQAELMQLLATTGASYEELSRDTGLPIGTVTSRLSRARATLRCTLDLPPNAPVTALFDDPGPMHVSR
ncbi:RNA polymerase sigma factor [Actibacterium lipolyticum]|uniref:ECF RNA polymerase sigma factor SigE n=1 Tax=Actibacterium lipolyticum TaxID=1524263 RepID=A0A238KJV0_9RHOB|nr:RNA polymerase sigma factor [Actibacterium lipolyticum]SMX42372.1 ECF RNA polymerase sigma factor SigE [Actibacterium lipolyticum]